MQGEFIYNRKEKKHIISIKSVTFELTENEFDTFLTAACYYKAQITLDNTQNEMSLTNVLARVEQRIN